MDTLSEIRVAKGNIVEAMDKFVDPQIRKIIGGLEKRITASAIVKSLPSEGADTCKKNTYSKSCNRHC